MIKTYTLLTKPGIILGNLITTTGGFFLAHNYNIPLFLLTALGLGLIIASACLSNNIMDRHADAKMERTKKRAALLTSPLTATLIAALLLLIGTLTLLFTNPLATLLALAGFFFYVVMYTLLKYHTPSATLIGSIAGAIPPVVGYTAASSTLNTPALILFTLLFLWQMPHFYAIALYRLPDYAAASIPTLPLVKGPRRTHHSMILYILAFTLTLPFLLHSTPLIIMLSLSILWLLLALKGPPTPQWARRMFLFSLLIIISFSTIIAING